MLKVYTASKIKEWPLWHRLRKEWPEFEFTSRWLDMVDEEDTAMPADFARFWIIDAEDVARSDVVLVYGDGETPLRGALVEAGMAIALSKRVIVVGKASCYGTWQHHPLVTQVDNLSDAHLWLEELAHAHH